MALPVGASYDLGPMVASRHVIDDDWQLAAVWRTEAMTRTWTIGLALTLAVVVGVVLVLVLTHGGGGSHSGGGGY
jgi:hypothetical protein